MINKIKELLDWIKNIKNIFTIDQAKNLIHYIKSDLYNDINFAAHDIYQTFRRWFIFLWEKGGLFINYIKYVFDLIIYSIKYVTYALISGCKIIYNFFTSILPNFAHEKINQAIDLILYIKNNIFEFISDKINQINKIKEWVYSWSTFDWKSWILSWNDFDFYNWFLSIYNYLFQYNWHQLYLNIIRFNWSKWVHYSIFDMNSEFHKVADIIYYCTYYGFVQIIYTTVWVIVWWIVWPTILITYPYVLAFLRYFFTYHQVTWTHAVYTEIYEQKFIVSPFREDILNFLKSGADTITPYVKAIFYFIVDVIATYWTYVLYVVIIYFICDAMHYRWYWYGHMYVSVFCYMLKEQGAYPHWSYFVWICWFIFLQSKIFYPFYFWYDDYKADSEGRKLRADIAHQSKLYIKEQKRKERIAAGHIEITFELVYLTCWKWFKTGLFFSSNYSFGFFIYFTTFYNYLVLYEVYVVLSILYYILRGFIYAFILIPIVIIYIYLKIIIQIILIIAMKILEIPETIFELIFLVIINIFKRLSNAFLTSYSFCKFILYQLITKLKPKVAYRYNIIIYYKDKKKEIQEIIKEFFLFPEKINNKVLIFYKEAYKGLYWISFKEIELLMEDSIKKILNFLFFCTSISLLINYSIYKFIIHAIPIFYKKWIEWIINDIINFYKKYIENDITNFYKKYIEWMLNDITNFYKKYIKWMVIEWITNPYENFEIINIFKQLIGDIVLIYNSITTLIVNFLYNLNFKINKHKQDINFRIKLITDKYYQNYHYNDNFDDTAYYLKNKLIYIFEKYYLIIKANLSFLLIIIKETKNDIKRNYYFILVSRFITTRLFGLVIGSIFSSFVIILFLAQLDIEGFIVINKFLSTFLSEEYIEMESLYTLYLYEVNNIFTYMNELDEPLYYLTMEELKEFKESKKFDIYRDQMFRKNHLYNSFNYKRNSFNNKRELISFIFMDPLDFNKNCNIMHKELKAYYQLKYDVVFNKITNDWPQFIDYINNYLTDGRFKKLCRETFLQTWNMLKNISNLGYKEPNRDGDYRNFAGLKIRRVFMDENDEILEETETWIKY